LARRRRKAAPPGRVHVICSHRDGDAEPKRIKLLQMLSDPESPGGIIITGLGGMPAEGNAYVFRCGQCRRNLKIAKDKLTRVIVALAEMQQTHGERPIMLDISRIDRAL
jgi:hypothetical protein